MVPLAQLVDKLISVQDDLACEAKKNAYSITVIAEVINELMKGIEESVQRNREQVN